MIGIVSHAQDLHTQEVARHLDAAGAPWALVDTAHLPAQVALTAEQDDDGWAARWRDSAAQPDGAAEHPLAAADLRVMWWRRPQPFTLHDDVRSGSDRMFAQGECAAAVAGLWSCLPAVWVNDPDRDEAASRKMWQLKVAAGLGLRVPRTCMTNDPDRAREFIADVGDVVYKSFSATPQTWRETRPVRPEDLTILDSVRFAPVIFQQRIPGADIRVTVVGDQVFAAEFDAGGSAYAFDFRIDTAGCATSVHALPPSVGDRLLALMRRLGLWYGAIDLRRDGEDYVFLEVNPAGQWLFVEYATGLPIASALAGLLARLDAGPGPDAGRAPARVRERELNAR